MAVYLSPSCAFETDSPFWNTAVIMPPPTGLVQSSETASRAGNLGSVGLCPRNADHDDGVPLAYAGPQTVTRAQGDRLIVVFP